MPTVHSNYLFSYIHCLMKVTSSCSNPYNSLCVVWSCHVLYFIVALIYSDSSGRGHTKYFSFVCGLEKVILRSVKYEFRQYIYTCIVCIISIIHNCVYMYIMIIVFYHWLGIFTMALLLLLHHILRGFIIAISC